MKIADVSIQQKGTNVAIYLCIELVYFFSFSSIIVQLCSNLENTSTKSFLKSIWYYTGNWLEF